MADFECTCSVVKGERDVAYGEDCYCWYPKPNYNERIVRCRDCKYSNELMGEPDMLDCQGRLTTTWDYYNDIPLPNAVEPGGFCAWGEPKEGE